MEETMRLGLIVAAAVALAGCEVRQADPEADAEQDVAAAPQVTGPEPAPQVPPPAPQGPALAEANSQNGDFRMAVTEASRSNGVLTVKARVTLLDGETGSRRLLYSSDADELYLVSGDQKYMILKDNEGVPLTTSDGYDPSFRRLGDTNMWWGKFPAPPPEVRTVSLYFKNFEPAENIPITDR
jgi:hypothetical protein